MPHFILEYTNNLKAEANIPLLLKKVNDSLLSHPDIIPIGGLRSRAIELGNYVIADGSGDDAFVHAILKIGKGRTEAEKKKIGDDLFSTIDKHFIKIFDRRYLALSMELYEFPTPTYKHNNIHKRFQNN